MFLINPIETRQGSLYGQQNLYIDTLVGTVWVVHMYVIHMVSFYGILAK